MPTCLHDRAMQRGPRSQICMAKPPCQAGRVGSRFWTTRPRFRFDKIISDLFYLFTDLFSQIDT